jgi:hypothetical protein
VRGRADLGGACEIVPTVDGREVTDLIHAFEQQHGMETRPVSYGGLIPTFYKFGPLDAHFLGRTDSHRSSDKVPLLGCECGEWGCWPLLARITVSDEFVTWSDFEQPYRKDRDYQAFGPYIFERRQYGLAAQELSKLDAS